MTDQNQQPGNPPQNVARETPMTVAEDDFQITITPEEVSASDIDTRQPPFRRRFRRPLNYKMWLNPTADNVRIILTQTAYRKASEHARSFLQREVGGVLLGEAYEHDEIIYVEIKEVLHATNTDSGPGHLTFTPETWAQINRQREEKFPDLRIVGWYHTHPNLGVFFSEDDIFVQHNFFKDPWHVALVIDPVRQQGIFFAQLYGELKQTQGFYELFDPDKRGGSIIKWRNLDSSSGDVRDSIRIFASENREQQIIMVGLVVVALAVFALMLLVASQFGFFNGQIFQLQSHLTEASTQIQGLQPVVGTMGATLTQDAQATALAVQVTQVYEAQLALTETAAASSAVTAASTAAVATPEALYGISALSIEQQGQRYQDGAQIASGEPLTFILRVRNGSTVAITDSVRIHIVRTDNGSQVNTEADILNPPLAPGQDSELRVPYTFPVDATGVQFQATVMRLAVGSADEQPIANLNGEAVSITVTVR